MDPYETVLTPEEEAKFRVWKQQYAPRDSGQDYDLRGAFKAGLQPGSNGHWDDRFKKPNHPTFSKFSQYAAGENAAKAGTWNGETYVPAKRSSSPRFTDLIPQANVRQTGPNSWSMDVPKAPGAGNMPTPQAQKAGFSNLLKSTMFAPSGKMTTDSAWLKSRLKPGLQPYADLYVQHGSKYGVDPALLAAISSHETGHGTSNVFLRGFNAMGVSDSKGAISYPDQTGVSQSIERMAKMLGTSGIYKPARDTNSIENLAKIYAPVGAGNDPRGLNNSWQNGVSNLYKALSQQ